MTEREQLSDAELMTMLDTVTLWVAATPAPKSFWSLREALGWLAAQPRGAEFSLYRPPDHVRGTHYVPPEQIARLHRYK
jgi:hypothetical protein